jgi:glyoxylase-like metal-dependent hydrolase (beta-lactamase superfamily II)
MPSGMRIERFVVPPASANVYLVADEDAKEAFVVDTGLGGETLRRAAREGDVAITHILNTHGHPDHTADNAPLKAATEAKIGIHEADEWRLQMPPVETHPWFANLPPPSQADLKLREGSELHVGSILLRVLHTPGHSEGSVCFWLPEFKVLFAGDTLLKGTHGPTDILGGSPARLMRSLRRLYEEIPGEARVLPGHGPPTVLEAETWIPNLAFGAQH